MKIEPSKTIKITRSEDEQLYEDLLSEIKALLKHKKMINTYKKIVHDLEEGIKEWMEEKKIKSIQHYMLEKEFILDSPLTKWVLDFEKSKIKNHLVYRSIEIKPCFRIKKLMLK